MLGRLAAAWLLVCTAWATPAAADDADCWQTAWRCDDINTYRATHGLAPLDQRAALQDAAKSWARQMATDGVLRHSPEALRGEYGGEIVGMAPDWLTVLAAWDQSAPHRAILTADDLHQVGIGRARSADGTLFAAVVFR